MVVSEISQQNLIPDPLRRKKVAQFKREAVLTFLREETWSTADVLRQVTRLGSRQAIHKTLKAMEKDGLVKCAIMSTPNGPFHAWGITPQGLLMSISEGEPFEERAHFEPQKVTLGRVSHQVDLQQLRLNSIKHGWTDWRRGERLGFQVKKRPDAIAKSPGGDVVAFEVERTIKTTKRYRQIVLAHLVAMKAGHWNRVLYVTKPGVSMRVKALLGSIEYAILNGQRVTIKPEHHERFEFIDIDGIDRYFKAK